jgi:ribosome maturation factor RimP
VPQPAPTLIADDPRTAAVAEMIAPTVEDLGYELVRVHLSSAAPPTLQVMVERADRAGMTVDHCAEVSRAVSAILDVEDPISGAYTLEVSSPGIDRPLTRAGDFDRFAGFEAKLETRQPIDGRRRFRGRLDGLAGETGDAVAMRVEQDGEQIAVAIPLAAIHRAKLVLTDDLIEASGG